MWRVAVAVLGMVALVSCGSAGADRDAGNSEQSPPTREKQSRLRLPPSPLPPTATPRSW